MFGEFFYNEGLRKMTIAFGQLFNNIFIQSTSSTGAVTKRVKVPLAYAPKQKFLVRLEQKPDLNERQFALTLPRMGFEISGISYDPTRKLTRVQKYRQVTPNTQGKKHTFNYVPVPYNIGYSLHCFTETAENGLQIVEQILPFFQPDYSVTMNLIPEMDIKRDVPVVLNSVSYEDTYDGAFTQRRAVIYNLSFTAKTYLYGPISHAGVIKKVTSEVYTNTTPETTIPDEKIIVQPDPLTATADSDFGFTTTIE